MNRDQAQEFEAHPMQSYDPHGARDKDSWIYNFRKYREYIVDEIVLAVSPTAASKLFGRYENVLQKIFKFERATHCLLISYVDSKGRMRQNRSILEDLITV